MGLLDQVLGAVLKQGGQGQGQGGLGGLGDLLGGGSQTGGGGLGDLLGGGQGQAGGGFGDLLGGLAGGQQKGGGNLLLTLLPLALALLQNRSGGAGGGAGLGGLLDQLRAGGLGQQADSWVSGGANEPVSPEALENALGRQRLSELAAQSGLTEAQTSGGLAALLPELVNQLTPQGQLPADSDVDDALGDLRRSLGA